MPVNPGQGQAQAVTSANSRTAVGHPCSPPTVCRRRDWGQRAVFPLMDSGMTFRHLRPMEGVSAELHGHVGLCTELGGDVQERRVPPTANVVSVGQPKIFLFFAA